MNEMMRRVARALCIARGENPDAEDIVSFPSIVARGSGGQGPSTIMRSRSSGPRWQQYKGEARAAVEAMSGPPEIMAPLSALEQLACVLREKMEHLDPTETGDLDWENMRERDRQFYILCVKNIMLHAELVLACLRELSNRD